MHWKRILFTIVLVLVSIIPGYFTLRYLNNGVSFRFQAMDLIVGLTLPDHPVPLTTPQAGGYENITEVATKWYNEVNNHAFYRITSYIFDHLSGGGKSESWLFKIVDWFVSVTHLLEFEFVKDLLMLNMIYNGYAFVPTPPAYSCVSPASGWSAATAGDWQVRALPIKENFPIVDGKPLPISGGVNSEHPGKTEKQGQSYSIYNPRKETPENEANLNKFIETIATRNTTLEGLSDVKPDFWAPHRTNVLFTWFAQWFVEMFFKTGKSWVTELVDKEFPDIGRTWSGNNIDLSNVYGHDTDRLKCLREANGEGANLTTQWINGEEYLPFYNSSLSKTCHMVDYMMHDPTYNSTNHTIFMMGHPRQNLHPGIVVINTLFVRMHNKLVYHLQTKNPHWNNATLFEKARLMLTGMILKMVVEDYIQHINPGADLFQFAFKPDLLQHYPQWQFHANLYLEFNLLYRWHFLAPEVFDKTPVNQTFFRSEWLLEPGRGLKKSLEWAFHAPAHLMGFKSSPEYMNDLSKATLRHSRELGVGSFNEYRMRFGLPPYKSIDDLTGASSSPTEEGSKQWRKLYYYSPEDSANAVRGLYGIGSEVNASVEEKQQNVNLVEYYVGLLTEKIGEGAIFPQTLTKIVLSNAMKGIFASPLCSKSRWRPETFGGQEEFDMVKGMNLRKFVQMTVGIDVGEKPFRHDVDFKPVTDRVKRRIGFGRFRKTSEAEQNQHPDL